MIGLLSRKDLDGWSTNLYLRPGSAQADFENLGVFGHALDHLRNGHPALDMLNFEMDDMRGAFLTRFRVDQGEAAAAAASSNTALLATVPAADLGNWPESA